MENKKFYIRNKYRSIVKLVNQFLFTFRNNFIKNALYKELGKGFYLNKDTIWWGKHFLFQIR